MPIQTEILRSDAIEWLSESLGTDEPDILLDVIQTFRADGANIIVRMKEALLQDDGQTLFRCAHTLKSSSSIVGAEQLSELCETFELTLRRKQSVDATESVKAITDAFDQVDNRLALEIKKLEQQT